MKKMLFVLSLLYLFTFNITTLYAQDLEVSAGSAALIDGETGLVLYGKEPDARRYPASVTKIMTALLVLENFEDTDERLTFSRDAVFSLPSDASHIAMDEGETLTIYDALHGLLLASANEVANALAEHVAGSREDFVDLMNKRAATLGAEDTHFVNPNGLFDEGHYTTARDMALIMREASKHPLFNEIIAKRRYDIAPTERKAEVRELLNSNKLIQSGEFFNEYVIGGKTGFTDEAQHTLVTYAEKDGRKLIAAVMFGDKNSVFEETNALLDYGFGLAFEERVVFDSAAYKNAIEVVYNDEKDAVGEGDSGESAEEISLGEIPVKAVKDLSFALPSGFDMANIRQEITAPDKLEAPVLSGDVVGQLSCYAGDVLLGASPLVAAETMLTPAAETQPVMQIKNAANAAHPDGDVMNPTEQSTVENITPAEPLNTTLTDGINPNQPAAEYDLTSNYYLTLVAPLVITLTALVVSLTKFIRRRRHGKYLQMPGYSRISGNIYKYK